MITHILHTGLTRCFNSDGYPVSCRDSGQDAEFIPGIAWPRPRFSTISNELIEDLATNLLWPVDANIFTFPMSWSEGLTAVDRLNRESYLGRNDWRLPNRRELRSLIDHSTRKPALPEGHPFENVFLGWYWTSTSSAMAPGYAWYVHMEGGRMFFGKKSSHYLVWPVCGLGDVLPVTGQSLCHDHLGTPVECRGTGQDAELQKGVPWPSPRFQTTPQGELDRLTGLTWWSSTLPETKPTTWQKALESVELLADRTGQPWRLPTINELESLVDADNHTPALPSSHPFSGVRESYWSSTTSGFEPDWAYVLYLHKGAVGVGYKKNRDFAYWPVLPPG